MSRTDKDMPWWVQSTHWIARHVCDDTDSCVIPNSPPTKISKKYTSTLTWRRRITECEWFIRWDRPSSQLYYVRNKRDYRRVLFHGPQRRAVRDAARAVVQGDHDTEFPDGRGRRSVHCLLA